MATETVSSNHHTTQEPVQKVNEETQTVKQEDVPLSKEDAGKDEEEKPKTEESAGSETTVTKLEETAGVKQTEPPVVVEVEKVADAPVSDVPVEIGSPKTEELAGSETTETKLKETAGTEPSIVVEVEKVADAPVSDVPVEIGSPKTEESAGSETTETKLKETAGTEPSVVVEVEKVADAPVETGSKGVENSILDQEPSSTPGPAGEAVEGQPKEQLEVEAVENQPEDQPAIEVVEAQPEEHPAIEAVEKQPEEKPAIENVEPKSSTEAVDEPVEHLEDFVVKDSEPEVVKQVEEVSEAECKIEEKPELVAEVEETPQEETQVAEEVEKRTEEIETSELVAEVEAKPQEQTQVAEEAGESVEGKVTVEVKPRESVESEVIKNGGTLADQEPVAFENSVSTNEEAQTDSKEEGGDSTSDVVENAGSVATINEDKTVMEGLEDKTLLAGKVEEEIEEKHVKIEEESEEKKAKTEESIKIKDVSGTSVVAEKSFEGEQGSREVEVVVIEKGREENVKEDTPTSVESNKDKDVEGNVDEVNATATANEEPKKTVKTDAIELASTKEAADEIAYSDPPNLESSKDGKTREEAPRQEVVVVKPSPKQSSNIISKVKQSIVKVKKAIIGKSPSSKTLSPEAKDDDKVKST